MSASGTRVALRERLDRGWGAFLDLPVPLLIPVTLLGFGFLLPVAFLVIVVGLSPWLVLVWLLR